MHTFTDQLQRVITLTHFPQRIVSLVPSISELLLKIGLEKELVGITDFCPTHSNATRLKGTKNFDVEKIRNLNPDLILANKEENTKENIELLSKDFTVWVSDIQTLDDALQMIESIGKICNREPETAYLNHLLHEGFRDLKTLAQIHSRQSFLYFIWRKPYMVAGNDTLIHYLAENFLPLKNTCKEARYPILDKNQLVTDPEWIFLSSEPYPFSEKHLKEIQELFPQSKIMYVDGSFFSWYGSRLIDTIHYFHKIINEITKS